MVWTPEQIERVRTLAAAGFSASQVAYQIGGVTRNAVVGVAHRQKIQFFGTSSGGKREHVDHPKPRPYKAPIKFIAAPIEPPLEPLMVLFDDLGRDDCRFAFGDSDFKFCGLPALEGRPWCQHHARLCYQPMPERRDVIPIRER